MAKVGFYEGLVPIIPIEFTNPSIVHTPPYARIDACQPCMRCRVVLARAMVAKVGGVFGTLTYPHLIRTYSGYYGHLASHMWGSLVPPIHCLCNKTHLKVLEPPIYGKCKVYLFLVCSLWEFTTQSSPHTIF
jgi:hypothetical protein